LKYLVTGGCGFIGSNFIHRCIQKNPKIQIISLDAMLTGSNIANIEKIPKKNNQFVKGNICDKNILEKLIPKTDIVINFAAESHVDRSIVDPNPFIKSNVLGVFTILEVLRKNKKVKLLHISTDEVYGESLQGKFSELHSLKPSNPYSATKASAEMLIMSYARTYDIDTIITRCTNNYGPMQHPEKLIPKTILFATKNEPMTIHGDGSYKRQWIHVLDHCDALLRILSKWKKDSSYNISGNTEVSNIDIIKKIFELMGKKDLIRYVPNRPGQDTRYRISTKLIEKEIGFKPRITLDEGLKSTINWYSKHTKWWSNISINKLKNLSEWNQ